MEQRYIFTCKAVQDLSIDDKKEWENYSSQIIENTYSLYQTFYWASFFSEIIPSEGIVLYTLRDEDGHILVGGIGCHYPLARGWSWLYLQRGPLWNKDTSSYVDIFFNELKKNLKKVLWIRFDPPYDSTVILDLVSNKWNNAHKEYHPKRTLVLDLAHSEEDILKQMHPKGRYNIRVAEKKGVEVVAWQYVEGQCIEIDWFGKEQHDLQDPVSVFARLMQETGERDGFSVHDKSFYETMLHTLSGRSVLLLSRVEGNWIGGGIFVYTDTTMIYYYGASLHSYRQFMAPYLVQWKALLYAKSLGKDTYDFLGIGSEKEDDALAGVTQFKKKFGGRVREYMGTFEIVLHPVLYYALLLVKKFRAVLKRRF